MPASDAALAAPGWLLVLTEDGKLGYVAASYVRVLQVFTSSEEEEYYDLDVSLQIMSSDFECKEKLLGDGFESCSIEFYVSLSSTCEKELYVNVACDAQFKYETENEISPKAASDSAYGSTYVRNRRGSTFLSVDWRPTTILNPVTRVQLTDASCM